MGLYFEYEKKDYDNVHFCQCGQRLVEKKIATQHCKKCGVLKFRYRKDCPRTHGWRGIFTSTYDHSGANLYLSHECKLTDQRIIEP